MEEVVHCYKHTRRRLLVLGYNATLTTSIEAPQAKRTFDQMQVRYSYPASLRGTAQCCTTSQNTL